MTSIASLKTKSKLRDEIRGPLIQELIGQIPKQSKIVLWQSINNKQQALQVKLVKYNLKTKTLKFFTRLACQNFKFMAHKPIYFYEANRIFIFKTTIIFQSPYELEIRIPGTIKIKEYRKEGRQSGLLEELFVKFKLNHKNIHGIFEKKLFDYCTGGFSFLIKKIEAKHYYDGDYIKILSNSKSNLSSDCLAQIAYTTPYFDGIGNKSSFLRVGVRFC